MLVGSRPLRERIPWLGRLRWAARRRFLAFLQRVLQTEDARTMLVGCLQGAIEPAPGLAPYLLETPYTDVGKRGENTRLSLRAEPIFITARFRSGSTLLWNLFRHVPEVTAYYEPLNERRWFDPAIRGAAVDLTHRQVSDYWKEYEGLEILGDYYREEWIYRDLFMGPRFQDPHLSRYLEILIDQAPGRPVLQFNRVDFRLPWLRRNFPAARIVHLYRHPRDQWLSSLFGSSVPRDVRLTEFPDHFYLRDWGQDLKYHFPFLDERRIEHPYMLFYFIWKLSYAFGRRFGDYSLAYESLLSAPRQELEQLFAFLGIDHDPAMLLGLIEAQSVAKWRRYADDAWFRRLESACEAVLTDFVGARPGPSMDPALASCQR